MSQGINETQTIPDRAFETLDLSVRGDELGLDEGSVKPFIHPLQWVGVVLAVCVLALISISLGYIAFDLYINTPNIDFLSSCFETQNKNGLPLDVCFTEYDIVKRPATNRAIDIYTTVVGAGLVPLLTLIFGYIFGTRYNASN